LPLATRPIGARSERLPIVGLGTYIAYDLSPGDRDWPTAREGLRQFAAGGGQVVDTSPMYGAAEAAIGEMAAELRIRDDLFIATKIWATGRDAGRAQVAASLRKLGGRRLDLVQVHNLVDAETHLRTLRSLRDQGLVRYIGVTHYEATAYPALEAIMRREPLDFIEVNYSIDEPASAERILPLAEQRRIAVIVNRPFGGGELFSKVRDRPVPAWAADIGCSSWAQLMLKYVIAHPAVTCAAPGTHDPRHIADNLAAGRGPLPDAAMRARIVRTVTAT
jgi:diketogulonate reductase-like aldo/keto reductase